MTTLAIRLFHQFTLCLSIALGGAAFSHANGLPGKGDLNADLHQANEYLAAGQYEKAYEGFLIYAEDNQLAQFSLGIIELYGWGRPENPVAACNWFEPSAAEDVPMAQEFLGDCYRDGIHRPTDFEQAKTWYNRAVGNGLPQANCKLGKVYLDGKIVEKNVRKGIRLCEQSAEGGSVEAQQYLAERFEQGDDDIERDLERALYWYRVAAASNIVEAQYHVARILRSEGTDAEGYKVALKNAETAAVRGYQPAYLLTANLYAEAPVDEQSQLPTPTNLAKAYMWAQAAVRDAPNEQDQKNAEALVQKIRTVMPKSWEKDLDGEVDDHFEGLETSS